MAVEVASQVKRQKRLVEEKATNRRRDVRSWGVGGLRARGGMPSTPTVVFYWRKKYQRKGGFGKGPSAAPACNRSDSTCGKSASSLSPAIGSPLEIKLSKGTVRVAGHVDWWCCVGHREKFAGMIGLPAGTRIWDCRRSYGSTSRIYWFERDGADGPSGESIRRSAFSFFVVGAVT